jgi:hypothetical protein
VSSLKKREWDCVWCRTLKNFNGGLKIKRRVRIFLIYGVTCPYQGLLTDITFRHVYSGETVLSRLKSLIFLKVN